MPIDRFVQCSKALFRHSFARKPEDIRRTIRVIDITDDFCRQAMIAAGLPPIGAFSVFSIISDMVHRAKDHDPWSFSGQDSKHLIVENFSLAWACCHIAWYQEADFESEVSNRITDLPNQNCVSKICRGLEDYWIRVEGFTSRSEDLHKLVLPNPEKAGHEAHITSTKRLVIPRRMDLNRIRSALSSQWDRMSTAARIRKSIGVDRIDARLLEELNFLYDGLRRGEVSVRSKKMWSRIEDALEPEVAKAGRGQPRRVFLMWDPDPYQDPHFLCLDCDEDTFRKTLEDEGHSQVRNKAARWELPEPTNPKDRLLLFAEEDSSFWSLTNDGNSPIGRILVHGSLDTGTRSLLGLESGGTAIGPWELHKRSPAPMVFDDPPDSLSAFPQLQRRIPRTRLSLRGGIRCDPKEYVQLAGYMPQVACVATHGIRLIGLHGASPVQVVLQAPGFLPIGSPGTYRIEGLDPEGAVICTKDIKLVEPAREPTQTAFRAPAESVSLCDPHPEGVLDPTQNAVLPSFSMPSLWPRSAITATCDATAWFSSAISLGPRIGEMSMERVDGFGWNVRFNGSDEPLLTWLGGAGEPDPAPFTKNISKGACRQWRKAFMNTRLSSAIDAEGEASLRKYRAVARDDRKFRVQADLGSASAARSTMEPDPIAATAQVPEVASALSIMAHLACRSNGRYLAGTLTIEDGAARDELLDPGRLLSWLPFHLNLPKSNRMPPDLWTILRIWQETGLIDIVAPASTSGLRWIARNPTWQTVRIHGDLQATLLGLIHPTRLDFLHEQAASAFSTRYIPAESAWAPRILRCTFPLDRQREFDSWASQLGIPVQYLPWTGVQFPEWITRLSHLARLYPLEPDSTGSDRESFLAFDPASNGWRRCSRHEASAWRIRNEPGSMPRWIASTPSGMRFASNRDDALLLGICHRAKEAFRRDSASIIRPHPSNSALPVHLPLALAHLCTVISPSLPGPGPKGWRYPFPNRFMAESISKHLDI